MANRKPPKYQILLPLLTRKAGATMAEMMKALRTKDEHEIRNTVQTCKNAGYRIDRVAGKDELPRWKAMSTARKPTTKKARSKRKVSPNKPLLPTSNAEVPAV